MDQIPEFRFDREKHEGWLGAVKLPSVTQIIKGCGLMRFEGDKDAMARGSAVDAGCRLQLVGKLDWATVDPALLGYHLSIQSFLDHVRPHSCSVGTPDYHPDYLYFGEFDFTLDDDTNLFDLKTGGKAKWHELQLSAYKLLLNRRGRKIKHCWNVYAQEDGSMARLEPHMIFTPNDFLACLNFYNVRERYV